jgi:serine/threonine protein kinase
MNKTADLPVPGDLFQGKYRILRLLGKGGMGAVFSADHEGLGQRVAVKFLLAEAAGNEEANARFKQEARAAAQIQNDHVARVVDVSTDGGLPYMVMEYLDGQDLSQVLEERTVVPQEEACGFLMQACDAIHAAHKAGIIHRDLKPSNLFLAKRGDGASMVKVLDFGISKAQNSLGPMSGALTSTKAMLGSPLYMSPEQLRSSKSVDGRADIWALGVILYELLTGSVPYTGENLGELFASILEQDPVPVRQRAPHVAPELEVVVMRCLQRQANSRYSSVAELALNLAPFAPAYQHLSVLNAARAQLAQGGFPQPIPVNAGLTQPIGQAGNQGGFSQGGMIGVPPGSLQPMQPPPGMQPPGYRPPQASVPSFAANTGNPVNVPVHGGPGYSSGGFVPAGGNQGSGAEAFHEASVAAVPVNKSSAMLVVGAVALVVLVVGGIGVYKVVGSKTAAGDPSAPTGSSSVPATGSSSAASNASAVASSSASAQPSATVAQAVSADPVPTTPPATAATAAVTPSGAGHTKPVVPAIAGGGGGKKPPPPPVTTAVATVTPPPPTAAPTPKPTGTLQTSR